MDLGAYAQIDDLSNIMTENGIYVPRLRGIRLMSEEELISQNDIEKDANAIALLACENYCEDRQRRKYIVYDDEGPAGINWNNVHGKKRKLFKYLLKKTREDVFNNLTTFNKYCGRNDVLYIHARIGGGNWPYYGKEVKNEPWFIERVDDPFDSTYCDIYAKIKPRGMTE